MPRVHTKTKSKQGKVYKCETCREDILPGESFHEWSRRFGRSGQTYRQHSKCGMPRPTQLSSRKTAVLEEAVSELNFSDFAPELDVAELDAEDGGQIDIDVSDLESLIEGIADLAREIASEYQDGYDAMPEGLNQGSTAQAMEEVAQELDSWADGLDPDLDGTFYYEPYEVDEDSTEEEQAKARESWVQEIQDAWDAKVDELRDAAESACTDWPEYQG